MMSCDKTTPFAVLRDLFADLSQKAELARPFVQLINEKK
jgi:hypothetical protein